MKSIIKRMRAHVSIYVRMLMCILHQYDSLDRTIRMSPSITGNDSVLANPIWIYPSLSLSLGERNIRIEMTKNWKTVCISNEIERRQAASSSNNSINCVMTTANKIIFNKYYNNPQADSEIDAERIICYVCVLQVQCSECANAHY